VIHTQACNRRYTQGATLKGTYTLMPGEACGELTVPLQTGQLLVAIDGAWPLEHR